MVVASLVSFPACGSNEPAIPPSVDLSAIRAIVCPISKTQYIEGSGFLIGDKIMLTANHVAELSLKMKCYDVETRTRIHVYKQDPRHDVAVMTGEGLPTDIPYIKYSCSDFKKGEYYNDYGYSDYGQERTILRMNIIQATNDFEKRVDKVEGLSNSQGMRYFNGTSAPGTSGGPVIDKKGYAVGVTNAGNAYRAMEYSFAQGMMCQR